MKKCVYTDALLRANVRIVSTRWQVEACTTQARNPAGITAGQNALSLESFAAQIHPAETVDRATALWFLRDLLRTIPVGRYQRIAKEAGFPAVLFGWISTLIGEKIEPDALAGPQKDLRALYAAYLSRLKERGLLSREMAIAAAAEKAAKETVGTINVSGFIDFRAVEMDFLDALAEKNEITVVLQKYGANAFVKAREAAFRRRGWQVEEQAAVYKEPPKRLLSAPTHALSARAALGEAASAAQRGESFDFVVSDAQTARALMQEAENAHLVLARPQAGTALQTHVGRDALALLRMCQRPDAATMDKRRALRSFPLLEKEETEEPDAERRWAEERRNMVDPIAFLRQKIAVFQTEVFPELLQTSDKAAGEWHAAEAVKNALRKMDNGVRVDGREAELFLHDTLEDTPVLQGGAQKGVRLLLLQESANLQSDHRIFVGFDRDFPPVSSENFLLRGRFAQKGAVLALDIQFSKEKLRVEDALFHAKKASFVLLRGEEGSSVSPLLSEVLPEGEDASLNSRLPVSDRLFSEKAFRMFAAAQGTENDVYGAYRKNRNRYGTAGTGTGGPYSASSLNTFVQCPYRYWLQYVLKAESFESNLYMARGNCMHAVLSAYMDEKRDVINAQLAAGKEPQIEEARVRDLTESFAEDADPPIPSGLLREMAEELIAYLQMDMRRIASVPYYRVGPTEKPFSFSIGEGDGRIWLEGKVDRSDCGDNKENEWIVDYKTGGTIAKTAIENGKDFQLPLYSMSRTPNAYVYYGYLRKPDIGAVYMPEAYDYGKKKPFSQEEWAEVLEHTGDRIFAIDQSIRNGQFGITPSVASCAYCPFAPVCRKGELA